MSRMSLEQAKEIIEGMGTTWKIRPLDSKESGIECRNRYALVSTANNKVSTMKLFRTGFEVVRFAKYIEEEKPQSMKKALEEDMIAWWADREKAQAAEYFREKNRALRIKSSLDEEV